MSTLKCVVCSAQQYIWRLQLSPYITSICLDEVRNMHHFRISRWWKVFKTWICLAGGRSGYRLPNSNAEILTQLIVEHICTFIWKHKMYIYIFYTWPAYRGNLVIAICTFSASVIGLDWGTRRADKQSNRIDLRFPPGGKYLLDLLNLYLVDLLNLYLVDLLN